jgi:elongation factor P
MIPATQLRAGSMVLWEGELCRVLKVDHVTPGKGHGMVQAKLRNIISGIQFEKRFRSSEKIETASLMEKEMEYLYEEGGTYHFMNTQTYEPLELSKELLDNAVNYLYANEKLNLLFHDHTPVGVNLPTSVVLEVTKTEPGLKGATATASYKPATVITGMVVQVPQFIKIGDKIKIKTEDDTYQERIN